MLHHHLGFMGMRRGDWGFGHGRAPEGTFERGALKLVILDLLKDKPAHGYELIKALEERSHGFYTPSAGSIYPILQMLTDMGFLVASESEGKKTYTITEAGLEHLRQNKEQIDHLREFARHHWPFESKAHLKETLVELHGLGRYFRGRVRNLTDDQLAKIHDVVSRASADIRKIVEG